MRRRELLKGLLGSLLSGQVLPQAIAKTAPVVPPVMETWSPAITWVSGPAPSLANVYEHLSQNFVKDLMRAEDEKFMQYVLAELDTPTETPTTGTLVYGTGTDIKKPLAVEF